MKILVINGPNLNLTGTREPGVYGTESIESINRMIEKKAAELGLECDFYQSNREGGLIDRLHQAAENTNADGIILNAGAYTHYSYAIRDAIAAIKIPVVETHMSNTAAREGFRAKSVIAPVCCGTVVGFGKYSYVLALYALNNILKESL